VDVAGAAGLGAARREREVEKSHISETSLTVLYLNSLSDLVSGIGLNKIIADPLGVMVPTNEG